MSEIDEWPPDEERLTSEIVASASIPLQLPDCFVEWLRDYWMDSSEAEAERAWRERCRDAWWAPANDMRCVGAILENPPANLVSILKEHGWVTLYDQSEVPWVEHGPDEYLRWLRRVHAKFTRILDEVGP